MRLAPGVYLAPGGSHAGTYAVFHRRVAAAALDWTLAFVVYLIASIPAGIVQLVPAPGMVALGIALALAPVLAYFAVYGTTGQTLGMRALDVSMVVAATGRAPGWRRSLVHAAIGLAVAVAAYVVFFVVFAESPPLTGYSHTDRVAIDTAAAVLGAGAAAKLWALLDPRRQGLVEKALGLVVVENVAPTAPDPSPWGGLWRPGGAA